MGDFAYYYSITRAFWTGENLRVYAVETHIPVLSNLAGAPVTGAMPLAIMPTALLVWLPFTLISLQNFVWSYSAWLATALMLLLSGLRQAASLISNTSAPAARRSAPLLILSLLSSTMITTLILGQSSVFAVGLLLILIARLSAHEKGAGGSDVTDALIVFLLSIKIHYFLAGLALIAGFHRWRGLILASAAASAAAILLTLRLGTDWVYDYRNSLSVFLSGAPPDWIAPSFVPENMVLFTTAFSPILGPDTAFRIAATLFLIFIAVAAFSLLMGLRISRPGRQASLAPFAWVAAAYLLFTPYMGHYEDLLLIALYAAAAAASPRRLIKPASTGAAALFLFFVLNRGLFPLSFPLWPFWSAKLIFIGIMLNAHCGMPESAAEQSSGSS